MVVVQQSQSSDKKTVRLVAVFSFSNFVIDVEFIVETQAPRNHFTFTMDAAIFWKKKAEIKVLYCSKKGKFQ